MVSNGCGYEDERFVVLGIDSAVFGYFDGVKL